MSNIIHTKIKQVEVTGKGKNKQEAFADALTKVSKKATSDKKFLIFKIEPQDFEVEEFKEIKEKEHFLFIFFPRIRISYRVKLLVNISVEYINLNEIPLEEEETSDNEEIIKNVKGV